MPDKHHEAEAEKILAMLSNQGHAVARRTHLLAQALEQAERRGREMFASLKESSG